MIQDGCYNRELLGFISGSYRDGPGGYTMPFVYDVCSVCCFDGQGGPHHAELQRRCTRACTKYRPAV